MMVQAPPPIPVSPAAVISKPATWQDDEDVFSTLLKYEKEVCISTRTHPPRYEIPEDVVGDQISFLRQVRAEKKEKKHFEKQKKAMGLGGGTSMIKPKEPAKPVKNIFNWFI